MNRRKFLYSAAAGLYLPQASRALPLHQIIGGATTPSDSGTDVNHAVFSGSQYLRLSSATPSGLFDGPAGTISFWIKFNGPDLTVQRILTIGTSTSGTLFVSRSATLNRISIYATNIFAAEAVNFRTTNGVAAANGWTHIMACWDTTATPRRKFYINGVSETIVETTMTANATLDYLTSGNTTITIGGSYEGSPTGLLNGALAELWFNDSYNDNIGDYYNAGNPVPQGANGELAIGVSPVLYLSNGGSGNSWNANGGTGGALTRYGGTLTTDANPPEFP